MGVGGGGGGGGGGGQGRKMFSGLDVFSSPEPKAHR